MTNYDNGDDEKNKDENDDENAASGLGSISPVPDTITTPRSCGSGSCNNKYGAAAKEHYIFTCYTIYIPYRDSIKDVPQTDVCKIWRFGLVSLSHEKIRVQLIIE